MLEITVVGGGVFLGCWLIFRLGVSLLNWTGIKAALKPEYFFVMASQADYENPDFQPVPDGQERLATQSERADINEKIERAQVIPPVKNPTP
jgi:hypothetical protein